MTRTSLPGQFASATETYDDAAGYYILRAPCGCHAARSMHNHPSVWCAYAGYHCCSSHGGGTVPLFAGASTDLRVGGGIETAGRPFPREVR